MEIGREWCSVRLEWQPYTEGTTQYHSFPTGQKNFGEMYRQVWKSKTHLKYI